MAPIQDEQERQLLDPTCVAWADHFELDGDRLVCRSGDVHAAYTHETYDLDEQRKVDLRAARAELIRESLKLLEDGPLRIERLLQIAQRAQLGIEQRRQIDEEIEDIRRRMADARRDLRQRAAVPGDASRACRCRSTEHHELPLALASQMLELELS